MKSKTVSVTRAGVVTEDMKLIVAGKEVDPLSDEGIRAVWGPAMTHEQCEEKRIEIDNLSGVLLKLALEGSLQE